MVHIYLMAGVAMVMMTCTAMSDELKGYKGAQLRGSISCIHPNFQRTGDAAAAQTRPASGPVRAWTRKLVTLLPIVPSYLQWLARPLHFPKVF